MSSTTPLPVISDGLPSQLPDTDPAETREWVDSLRDVVERHGPYRARFLMLKLLQEARSLRVGVPACGAPTTSTPSRPSASRGSPATRSSSAGSVASSGGTPP